MDTYTQPVPPKRRYLGLEQKRRIVEETLAEGASVAQIARAHRLYRAGQLCGRGENKLLPVRVAREDTRPSTPSDCSPMTNSGGTIYIRLRDVQVQVEGSADPGLLRLVLECLGR